MSFFFRFGQPAMNFMYMSFAFFCQANLFLPEKRDCNRRILLIWRKLKIRLKKILYVPMRMIRILFDTTCEMRFTK